MGKIEQYIKDKYYDNDFDKYIKLYNLYNKVKYKLKFLPNAVASTYLCLKYPFLKFKTKSGFFQKSCWYWSIPYGWRKAFGIQMCKELKEALKRHDFLYKYYLTDVKEKFGVLTIYDEGAPEEVHDILLKYDYISSRTCIECGRRAKYRTEGWVEPYCEDCIKKINTKNKPYQFYKDIDWYGWKK